MDIDDLNRSLFQEPDESLERAEAWSEPKGFLIGGFVLPARRDLAQQYFDAATVLVEAVERGECEDYRLAYAALFLYRHSLELKLKDIAGENRQTHDIRRLVQKLELLVQERLGRSLPEWFVARLTELGDFDPGSTAFRYAQVRDKKSQAYVPVAGELHVNLYHLQSVMDALNGTLDQLFDRHDLNPT